MTTAGSITPLDGRRGRGREATDADIVLAVLDGNTGRFVVLHERHARAVRRAVRDNVSEPDLVEEVVQEAFTRALERLHTLREPDRFRPWVLAIARHAAVDRRRHANRYVTADEDAWAAEQDPSPAPDELVSLAELTGLVGDCLVGLSPRDSTALSMVTYLGFTPSDVATALGVTPNAAKVLVHRARRRLRSALTLRLLTQREGDGCDVFEALRADDDPTQLARHVNDCEICLQAARSEVELYEFGVTTGDRAG